MEVLFLFHGRPQRKVSLGYFLIHEIIKGSEKPGHGLLVSVSTTACWSVFIFVVPAVRDGSNLTAIAQDEHAMIVKQRVVRQHFG